MDILTEPAGTRTEASTGRLPGSEPKVLVIEDTVTSAAVLARHLEIARIDVQYVGGGGLGNGDHAIAQCVVDPHPCAASHARAM